MSQDCTVGIIFTKMLFPLVLALASIHLLSFTIGWNEIKLGMNLKKKTNKTTKQTVEISSININCFIIPLSDHLLQTLLHMVNHINKNLNGI